MDTESMESTTTATRSCRPASLCRVSSEMVVLHEGNSEIILHMTNFCKNFARQTTNRTDITPVLPISEQIFVGYFGKSLEIFALS